MIQNPLYPSYKKKVTHISNNTIYIAPMLFLGANFVQDIILLRQTLVDLG